MAASKPPSSPCACRKRRRYRRRKAGSPASASAKAYAARTVRARAGLVVPDDLDADDWVEIHRAVPAAPKSQPADDQSTE